MMPSYKYSNNFSTFRNFEVSGFIPAEPPNFFRIFPKVKLYSIWWRMYTNAIIKYYFGQGHEWWGFTHRVLLSLLCILNSVYTSAQRKVIYTVLYISYLCTKYTWHVQFLVELCSTVCRSANKSFNSVIVSICANCPRTNAQRTSLS